MTPKPEELTGVTVGGEPLASVLAREQEQRKKDEAEEVSAAEVREKRRIIIRHRGAGRMPEETSRVSKRVRHLTPDEIRKEYGSMQTPYATQIENVLWYIKEKGPITASGIATGLGTKPIRIQGVVSILWRALGASGLLDRELHGGEYLYTASHTTTVETLYNEYKAAKIWKKTYKLKKPKVAPVRQPADLNPLSSVPTDGGLRKAIEQVVSQELGVKVEVSGQINIVFKFER